MGMAQRIAFFENQYIPLLSKHGIECQRSQIQHGHGQQMGGNMYGRGSAGYGNNQFSHIEDYVPGGDGAYDHDEYDEMNGQRQNSAEDDEIYDRTDQVANDDINEGTRNVMPADEESGDEQNAGDEMRQVPDDDDDEDEDIEHGDDGNNDRSEDGQVMEDV